MKRVLLALAGILLIAASSPGVMLLPNPRVCAEYFKSEAVFSGKVLSVTNVDTVIDGEKFCAGYRYRLKMYRVFRGPQTNSIEIFINNDSGRYLMDVGKEYLLFAYRESDYLTIYCYGNSCLLSEAKKKIRELGEIPKRDHGEVEGLVGPEPGLANVRVTIVGKDISYSALTDSTGYFRVRVKPGHYKAVIEPQRIDSRTYEFSAYDLSYDDPNSFSVPKGGCAEIAISALFKK